MRFTIIKFVIIIFIFFSIVSANSVTYSFIPKGKPNSIIVSDPITYNNAYLHALEFLFSPSKKIGIGCGLFYENGKENFKQTDVILSLLIRRDSYSYDMFNQLKFDVTYSPSVNTIYEEDIDYDYLVSLDTSEESPYVIDSLDYIFEDNESIKIQNFNNWKFSADFCNTKDREKLGVHIGASWSIENKPMYISTEYSVRWPDGSYGRAKFIKINTSQTKFRFNVYGGIQPYLKLGKFLRIPVILDAVWDISFIGNCDNDESIEHSTKTVSPQIREELQGNSSLISHFVGGSIYPKIELNIEKKYQISFGYKFLGGFLDDSVYKFYRRGNFLFKIKREI